MTTEASWLCKRIALGTAVLLTGAALAGSEPIQAVTPAYADGAAQIGVGSGSVAVTATGTYNVNAATQLFDQVNAVRESAGLDKLSWSPALQVVAQGRAAQVAVMGSGSTAGPSQATAENVTISTSGADLTALAGDWLTDNGSANYQNVIGSSAAVGISVFTADDGTLALVAEFGPEDGTQATPVDGFQTVALNVAPSDLTVHVTSDAESLEVGAVANLNATVLLRGTAPVQLAQAPVWSSSDPSVLSVEGAGLSATATAQAAGSAQAVLASADGTPLGSVAITVNQTQSEPAEEEPAPAEPGSDNETQPDGTEPEPDGTEPGSGSGEEGDNAGSNGAEEPGNEPTPDAGNEPDGDGSTPDSPEGDGEGDGASNPEDSGETGQTPGNQPTDQPTEDNEGEGNESTTDVPSDNPDQGEGEDQPSGSDENPTPGTETGDGIKDEGDSNVPDVPAQPDADQPNTDNQEPGSNESQKPADGTGSESDPNGVPNEGDSTETPDDSNQQTIPVVSSFVEPEVYYALSGAELKDIPNTVQVVNPDGTEGTITVEWKFPEDMKPDDKGVLIGTADVVVEKDRTSEVVDDSKIEPETIHQVVQFVTSYRVEQVELDKDSDASTIDAKVYGSYAAPGTDADAANIPEFEIPVTWDKIPADATANVGPFSLKGTVNGNFSVEAEVSVVEKTPTAVKIDPLDQVTTQAGTEPILPTTVMVVWSDGSQKSAKVVWDDIPKDAYAQAGKTFQVNGTVDGTDLTATVDVKVIEAAPTVESVEASTVETYVGTAPKLPESLKVTWSDGTSTDEKVNWVEVPASSYTKEGTVSVSGTLAEHPNVTVSCTVKVLPLTITAIQRPAAVSTDAGVAPVLPATVQVTYSDGSVKTESVSWAPIDEASYHNAGTFDVEGTVNGTDLTTSITVNVAKPRITGVQNNLVIETTAGTAPVLPKTASIRWSNGDVTDEAVTWDAVDQSSYAKAGSFKMRGTVAGQTVYCTVNVAAKNAVVQTGDNSVPIPAIVGGAVAGVAIIAAAVALIVRARKGSK